MTNHWYEDWQHERHAALFDGPSRLDRRNLIRHYASFNDIRLLNERLRRTGRMTLLEVGCATGELYRYLRLCHPAVEYYGCDISEAAVRRAREKYPSGRFVVTRPDVPLAQVCRQAGLGDAPAIIYAKDVVLHQTNPLAFIDELLGNTREAVIIRLRTRDVGPTEWDPERSCQYHYAGWMPYIVLNLQELIDHIQRAASGCEMAVYRHHTVLGGANQRYLPKDCYARETGTAETAVGVFLRTEAPGRVTIRDVADANPRYTFDRRLYHAVRHTLKTLRGAHG